MTGGQVYTRLMHAPSDHNPSGVDCQSMSLSVCLRPVTDVCGSMDGGVPTSPRWLGKAYACLRSSFPMPFSNVRVSHELYGVFSSCSTSANISSLSFVGCDTGSQEWIGLRVAKVNQAVLRHCRFMLTSLRTHPTSPHPTPPHPTPPPTPMCTCRHMHTHTPTARHGDTDTCTNQLSS